MRMNGGDPQNSRLVNGTKQTDNATQETGVPRLDEILGGGLPTRSLILIVGLPGSGKTTLASQIAFQSARAGKTALILTALSESTDKLITHLSAFSFFDPALIGGAVQFLSLQSVLTRGLRATGETIITEARRVKADIVLLDGFRGMRNIERDPQEAREFLYTVGTTLGALGASTIVTSESDPRDPTFFPESTTADVIIGLHYQLKGVRQIRSVEVIKARTNAPLPGLHALALSNAGASVYPQFEERIAAGLLGSDAQTQGARATANDPHVAPAPRRRANFGLPAFDAMLRGGIPLLTSTVLAGSLGSGKTLLAIYYALAGVRAGQKVVYLGFRETRDQLIQAAEPFDIGPELARALQPRGGLTFIEMPPIKLNADVLAHRLLAEIDQVGATRLVIDSIAEIEQAILRGLDPERLNDYMAALLSALRARNVTPLLIRESEKALASSLDLSADALSILAENMLVLQQIPVDGELQRLISIIKMRFSSHDTNLHEVRISAPSGLRVLESTSHITLGLANVITAPDTTPARPRRQAKRADAGGDNNG